MAIYVTSDLHGFPMGDLMRCLQSSGFSERDRLYILGDVIDRNNDGGVATLLWLTRCPNAKLILGNHEHMMLQCVRLLVSEADESAERVTESDASAMSRWLSNGAEPTIASMRRLLYVAPEQAEAVIKYLKAAPLWETVSAGEREFVLCHSGLGNFDPSRQLSDYSAQELLWSRPHPHDRYFENATTVIGHTPTGIFGCSGRAFHTDTWIDIDVGGAMGRPPMLLRLDDMREFYFNE